MLEIIKNMFRRKFRTFLTVFGIAIGIYAFTVMGSLALKFNRMIAGGKQFVTGQITVMPKGSSMLGGAGGATLPVDTLNKIAKMDGVLAVAPNVSLLLEDMDLENQSAGINSPATIQGAPLNSAFKNKNWETLTMKEGREPKAENEVAYGYSVALDKKVKIGDKVNIRGKEFDAVGIVDKTMTGPDTYVFMDIKPARELLVLSNPFLKSLKEKSDESSKISASALAKLPADTKAQVAQAKTFNIDDISTMAGVSWKDGYDSEVVANNIKDQFKDEVTVMSPKLMGEQIDKATIMFNAVILGAALLALIVGGFSIINTMAMSISERTREIGIKKAIGASNLAIAKEYTLEAGLIGLLGGLVGVGFGSLMIILVNKKFASQGAEIFLLETSFIIGVIVFSFVLGIIAGLIPAWRASKLNPVVALKEE